MARYVDGRSATAAEIVVAPRADGLALPNEVIAWYTLARVDDGVGAIILRRSEDTGERITLTGEEAEAGKAFAPDLFAARDRPRDPRWLAPSLAGAAAAIAALFLVGVPLAAEPLAEFIPARYQDHLAEIGWSQVDALTTRCDASDGDPGYDALGRLFGSLQQHALSAGEARIKVVQADFPNAFTLPDNSIVITTRMIDMAESPDEIAGVLAHELGHVEAGHVLAGVVRQMGAGLFFDVVFGGAGAGQAIAAINILALRFSREDEAEADRIGRRLMDEAGYDPGAMAGLFRRMAREERSGGFSMPELVSSHPDLQRRADEAARYARAGRAPALPPERWQALRRLCAAGTDPEAAPAPAKPGAKVDGKMGKEAGAASED